MPRAATEQTHRWHQGARISKGILNETAALGNPVYSGVNLTYAIGVMVLIRFAGADEKRRAVEALVGEFSFKSWSSGEMLVPEEALARLAHEDVPFTFEGSSAYEKLASLRDPITAPV